MAQLQELLIKIGQEQDTTLALGPDVRAQAAELWDATDSRVDIEVCFTLGWLYWYRYGALPQGDDQQDLSRALSFFDLCFLAGVKGLPSEVITRLIGRAIDTATKLTQDVLVSRDPDLATAAIEIWRRVLDAVAEDSPGRAGLLSNLGVVLQIRFERTGVSADLDQAVQALTAAVDSAEDHRDYSGMLSNLGNVLRLRFLRTEVLADLDEAVRVSTLAVESAAEDHPGRAGMLANLAVVLQLRFERTGILAHSDQAVQAATSAVVSTAEDDPDRAGRLSNLSNALRARFEHAGVPADLDQAVDAAASAAKSTAEDHPDRAGRLSNLAVVLCVRFERTGVLADLDQAVQAATSAVESTAEDRPNRADMLSNLAAALQLRFQRSRVLADSDQAVQAATSALEATAEGHPNHPVMQSNLGRVLRDRFIQTRESADLDDAVQAMTSAVESTAEDHPDRAEMLHALGGLLLLKFERAGVRADLDQAVRMSTLAVEIAAEDHPNRAGMLSNLGAALRLQFQRTGVPADLDQAVRVATSAVESTAEDDPELAVRLTNLGAALRARFGRNGVLADLDEAVRAQTLAVESTAEDHPDRASRLINLGIALCVRFERTGVLADLSQAIRAMTSAVESTAEGHPNRAGRLSSLSVALQARFERTGVLADLDQAVEAATSAVESTAEGHSDRAMRLINLGVALQLRFGRTGELADLDQAVQAMTLAVESTADEHPNRSGRLANLSRVLKERFRRTGSPADLDQAVRLGTSAVESAAEDHPDRATQLINLGNVLLLRFQRTDAPESAKQAADRYAEAAQLAAAPPTERIVAARAAARLIGPTDPARAGDLLEQAVRLLPEVASNRLFRSDQQFALGRFAGLASDAAAMVLLDGSQPERQRAERALTLLEAGRAVLLSQALGLRSDVSDLRAEHPELALRLTEVRALLDNETDGALAELGGAGGAGASGSVRAGWSLELAATLEQIRALPGFGTFGLPPSAGQLRAHADHGPVVSFAVSTHHSAALVLTADGVTAVPLPGITPQSLTENINDFHRALSDTHGLPEARLAANRTLLDTLAWLWDQAVEPVLAHLGFEAAPADGQAWPRLWWAPGGFLGLLPLHAAGHHQDPPGPDRRTVADRVVSSYTPTVRALGHARRPRPVATPPASLIVAMPSTPDLPDVRDGAPLHHVPQEAKRLAEILPRPLTLSGPEPNDMQAPAVPPNEPPTLHRVLAELPAHTIAHFACHGVSDAEDPSNSRLLLTDHQDHPMTVASLAPVNLQNAHLAYLSACSTSANHAADLLDEAIHLAGAFQLAGYPHVIGTLWPIDDEFAVDVAAGFYTALRDETGELNTDNAATALHETLRTLIAELDLHTTPWLWAPYIHAGA